MKCTCSLRLAGQGTGAVDSHGCAQHRHMPSVIDPARWVEGARFMSLEDYALAVA